jgi:hypothetical protein
MARQQLTFTSSWRSHRFDSDLFELWLHGWSEEDEEQENEDVEVALEDPSIKTSPLRDHDTRHDSSSI